MTEPSWLDDDQADKPIADQVYLYVGGRRGGKSSRSQASLVEHLVPVLDQLRKNLVEMNDSTAIELSTWPAAERFVDLWPGASPGEGG